VTSYNLIKQVLREPERFTSEGNSVSANLAGEAMLVTDTPVHDAVRGLWAKAFSPAAAVARRRTLEQLAEQLLAPMRDQLRNGATVDLVPLFETFAGKVLLGLLNFKRTTEGDFRRWYKLVLDSAAFAITLDHPLYPERSKAKVEIYEMLEAEVNERRELLIRGERPSDLVSLIAAAEGQTGITRTVVLDNLFNVFTGGADTTVRWMGNAVVVLHRHPEALAELRANPSLLPQALEEVMRLQSVTRFAIRTVRADGVELGGNALTRGDTVYLLTSLASRDPAVFEEPERFDIYRRAKPHLGFSYGMHKCIGMNLARVEAQALIGALLATAPVLELVDVDYGDESIVRGPERLLVRATTAHDPSKR
jgi:cytochrome P450